MGQLPPERLFPPLYNTSCVIFGPFWVKDTFKKRIDCKVNVGVIASTPRQPAGKQATAVCRGRRR